MIDESHFLPSPQQLNGNSPVDVGAESPLVYYKAKSVEVYLQQNYTPWNAGVWLIHWYSGSEEPEAYAQPVCSQYLVSEIEQLFDFECETPIAMVDHESDIVAPVSYTTIVKPASMADSLAGWKLAARVDLQNGTDAYHRELYTVNETGAKNRLKLAAGDVMILYMPYPVGADASTEMEYHLYHYSTSNYDDEPEKLTGENTEFGIRFEVTSLSPFVLEWNEPEPVPTATPMPTVIPSPAPTPLPTEIPDLPSLPKTGDEATLSAWLALLILSVSGLMLLRHRRA